MNFIDEHPVSRRPHPAAAEFYSRFARAYRKRSLKGRVLSHSGWDSFRNVSIDVLLMSTLSNRALYAVLEADVEVFITDAHTVYSYFTKEHASQDLYVVDDSLQWCLAITHNDDVLLVDPKNLLGTDVQAAQLAVKKDRTSD